MLRPIWQQPFFGSDSQDEEPPAPPASTSLWARGARVGPVVFDADIVNDPVELVEPGRKVV